MTSFEKNLELFSKVCPKTAVYLANIERSQCEFCVSEQGELNIRKKDFFLHSQIGVVEEAKHFLNSLLQDNNEAIYVYGIGLGYSYFVAKEWLKKNPSRRMIFLEDDLDVLKTFLETDRASELLKNPQVRLVAIDQDGDIDGKEVFVESCEKPFFITALPSYLQHKLTHFQKLMHSIHSLLFHYANLLKEELEHEQLALNFYLKLANIAEAKSVNGLQDAFSKIPCLIIGAGPSLSKDVSLLKGLEDRAIFFGSGSAVNALNAHGIYVHFGAGIDPLTVQTSRQRTNTSFEMPFFYSYRFFWEAMNWVQGPKIFTQQEPEKIWIKWFEKEIGIENNLPIYSGVSTSNFASSIALYLGCDPIIFLGIDMAFEENKKYAAGVHAYPGDEQEVVNSLKIGADVIEVTNFEGKTYKTNMTFLQESAWFTIQALENTQTHFVYGSLEGLGVNKVERIELNKISFDKQYDLLNQIHSALETCKSNFLEKKKVKKVMKKWEKSLGHSLSLIKKIQSETSLKRALLEAELQDEIAYQYLLKYVEAASQLKQIDKVIQSRFLEKKLDISDFSYTTMIKVGEVHLKAIQKALKIESSKSYRFTQKRAISSECSCENGLLKIYDSELYIDIFEPFHPQEDTALQYFANGTVKARQYYQNGLLHGPSRFFNQEGNLLAESWFYKGKREGKTIRYYASGELYAIERWKSGLRESKQEYYYTSGELKTLIHYKEGILHGIVKLLYPDGTLKYCATYIEGKKNGLEQFFYKNGQKLSEVEFENNNPVKNAQFWHENGQIAKKIVFNKSCEIYRTEWDANGNKLAQTQPNKSQNLMEKAESLKQSIMELLDGKSETIL